MAAPTDLGRNEIQTSHSNSQLIVIDTKISSSNPKLFHLFLPHFPPPRGAWEDFLRRFLSFRCSITHHSLSKDVLSPHPVPGPGRQFRSFSE